MPDAGANLHCCLVEGQGEEASEPDLFGHGSSGCNIRCIRVGNDAGADARTIRHGRTLDARASLGDHYVGGRLRPGLFAGGTTVARMGDRKRTDAIADT